MTDTINTTTTRSRLETAIQDVKDELDHERKLVNAANIRTTEKCNSRDRLQALLDAEPAEPTSSV